MYWAPTSGVSLHYRHWGESSKQDKQVLPSGSFCSTGKTGGNHITHGAISDSDVFRRKTVMYIKGLAPCLAHIDVKLMVVVINSY